MESKIENKKPQDSDEELQEKPFPPTHDSLYEDEKDLQVWVKVIESFTDTKYFSVEHELLPAFCSQWWYNREPPMFLPAVQSRCLIIGMMFEMVKTLTVLQMLIQRST